MTVFVDTSALYALLDEGNASHSSAAQAFPLLAATETLITHNYVLLESIALVQRRLGMAAVGTLVNALIRPIEIAWVDAQLHAHALSAALAARRRKVSLVDWTSFELMRRRDVTAAFAFDSDFKDQGFSVLP